MASRNDRDPRSTSKPRKPALKRKPRPREVIKLHPISEEMRQWSALLESELLTWPNTIAKPMFGFRSFYRGKKIFAALPKSREFDPVGSFIMKFEPLPETLVPRAESDSRIGCWNPIHRRGWFTFTLHSGDDIRDALWWLQQAHEHAKGKTTR